MSETTPTTTSRTPRGTTNRRLFVRMLAAAMRRRRSRALAAILSSAVGSATLFCLAAVCLAVPAQMSAQMRQFGANLIVVPVASEGSAPRISFQEAADVDAAVATALGVGTDQLATAAYRYETVRINKSPYMLAGIDVDRVRTLNGHWEVTGHWPGPGEVLIGSDVAEAAGFTIPDEAKFIFVEGDGIGEEHNFCKEKLTTLLAVHAYDGTFEDGVDLALQLYEVGGKGHSCGIASTDDAHIDYFGRMMPVSRIMVNQPNSRANAGAFNNGMPMTSSMGCGTWGGNIISENVSLKHYMNTTWVSRKIPVDRPSDAELFGDFYDPAMEPDGEAKPTDAAVTVS